MSGRFLTRIEPLSNFNDTTTEMRCKNQRKFFAVVVCARDEYAAYVRVFIFNFLLVRTILFLYL